MFEVGQKVVCIKDHPAKLIWADGRTTRVSTGLARGKVYTVIATFPDGFHLRGKFVLEGDALGVGVLNELGVDIHSCRRFRPLVNKPNAESISAGVEAFKQLAVDCPALVEGK